jgi:hypothetical protein
MRGTTCGRRSSQVRYVSLTIERVESGKMKAEQPNASTERILSLLLLLLQGEYSKDEIFAKIAAYSRGAEDDSQRKMLGRDLAPLERAGVQVECKAGRYFVALEQFERKVRCLCGEQMHPTALDMGILLWIPR